MLSLTSPVKTPFHAVPAAPKLAGLCLTTLALFLTDDPIVIGSAGLVVMLAYAICGRTFLKAGLRMLRPLWFFVAVVLIWHFWIGDYVGGLVVALRLFVAVALANLVTTTTRFDDLIDLLTRLTRPLGRIGLSPQALGFSVGLVIRFTPVLIEKGARLSEAWRARSGKRPKWNIILPLAVLALDDADQVAEALRARGGLNVTD